MLYYRDVLVIGDVHGKTFEYFIMAERFTESYGEMTIQLGDFGFQKEHDWFLKNMDTEKHKISFGNHDYIPYVNERHSLGNFSYLPKYEILTIRGANSIDKRFRTQGLDWFQDEELTYQEFQDCLEIVEKTKPEIIISHDAPDFLFSFPGFGKDKTRTNLEFLFREVHKPKKWIYGHHHKSRVDVIDGCEFQCLAELETIRI